MMFVFFLLLYVTVAITADNNIIQSLRIELARSKTMDQDHIIPFLCMILPSQEFIKAIEDQDFIDSIVYELGFGILGVRHGSWAARYKADPHKRLSCFATLYSIATAEIPKRSVPNFKKMIRKCCLPDEDL
jgi:hypothetical protein